MFAQVTAATLLTDCQNSIDVIERILAVYMCQWALHVIIKRKFFYTYICSFSTEFILQMHSIAQTYLRFCKNKWKSFWNTTSGFDIFVNRAIGRVVMTSFKFSRWRLLTSRINFQFQFDSVVVLRRSRSLKDISIHSWAITTSGLGKRTAAIFKF